jgi:predicted amidohydrolase YtcJ
MDEILVVGTLHTLDPDRPFARAALVRGGRFVCVGEEADCAARAGTGVPRIELGRGSAIPGLVDAHGHVYGLGRSRIEVSCAGADGAEACAARVADRARLLPPGRWIRGGGWDQNRWPGGAFPTAESLTRAAPEHPVVLLRVDCHAAWVNGAALALAGIGLDTPDPPGGKIHRDHARRPTGILVDAAMDLVLSRLPRPTAAELEEGILAGLQELAALGLTGVHDAGVEPDALEVYRRLADGGRLPLRVYAMIDGQPPLPALEAELARWGPRPDIGLLTVRAVKIYADGALGSRGAALLEDYADEPGNRGLFLTPPEELRAKVSAVARAGFQPAVHAIGDRACREVLDAFAAVPAIGALRPRIEHLQVIQPADLPRLAATGTVASMQPVHATSDAPWVAVRLGAGTERLRGAYAWRSVARAGATLAFGSDFPIEEADPRAGLHAAETRRTAGGTPFLPEQAISREAALRAFTVGPAHAAFAEGRRGMIRVGHDADLTAFGEDIRAVPSEALPRLTVTHTIVAGRVVFQR